MPKIGTQRKAPPARMKSLAAQVFQGKWCVAEARGEGASAMSVIRPEKRGLELRRCNR